MKYPAINSYFDDSLAQSEIKGCIEKGLEYVGHKLMVPNPMDYFVLPQNDQRYYLLNTGSGYRMVSNVCRHRQAILLEGRGNAKHVTCKLHCWTYTIEGQLKNTPLFQQPVENADLTSIPLFEWNGLLFKNRAPNLDLNASGLDSIYNFSGYQFHRTETETYPFNWKVFMEIYLENYHVFSMHPGLKRFVDPADLEWVIGEDYSVQKVGLGKDLGKANTEIYKQWQDQVIGHYGTELPRYGAVWGLIYPNVMIEWYPNVLVISTVYPKGAEECVNYVEFYFPEKLYKQNPSYFEKEMAAYYETAEEDKSACELLQKGRKGLFASGDEEFGPIEPFLEKGVGEFYRFLDR